MRVFWHDQRLERFIIAVLLAVGVGSLVVLSQDTEKVSMLKRGDFPGFYGPARMLVEGQGAQLYDRTLQAQMQQRYWPSMQGGVLVSVYPAFLSVALIPLAYLPPLSAKWVMAAFATLGACFYIISGILPRQRAALPVSVGVGLAVLFPPLLVSILGGQNTGVTLGLVGVTAWALRGDGGDRLAMAGVALALLCYKPQFGLMLILAALWMRQLWLLPGLFAVGALLYFAAVPWTGLDWISPWMSALSAFAPENFKANGPLMISPLSAVAVLSPVLGANVWFGITLTLGLYCIGLFVLLRGSNSTHQELERALPPILALAAVLSPQALFYDLGLVLPLLLVNILNQGDRAIWRMMIWSMALILAWEVGPATNLPLLAILGGAIVVWELYTWKSFAPRLDQKTIFPVAGAQ